MLNAENLNINKLADANSRVRGAILGASIGDAVACATDGLTHAQIKEYYNGDVLSLIKPDDRSFSAGREAGDVSDAFSIIYYLLDGIVENGGSITKEIAIKLLLKWADTDYFHFAGMTTRKAIEALTEVGEEDAWAFAGRLGVKLYKGHYYALSSNGSLKSWVASIFNLGQQDTGKLADDATEICLSSHDDILSVSAAVSVAFAMEQALLGRSFEEIFNAAIKGAEVGFEKGKSIDGIWDYPGPSTQKRLCLAKKCAYTCRLNRDNEGFSVRDEFRQVIGCGPEVAETLPLALGLLLAHKDSPELALVDAINIGDETSALASLVGAFLGAMFGDAIFPSKTGEKIENATNFEISSLCDKVSKL